MLSLFRNLPTLRTHEIPSIVQSMLLLLAAAISPTTQALHDARGPIDGALAERIRRYIDVHLLVSDLDPDRICRDIGVSRARLYQLFKEDGGVMRQITRRRLRHAYHVLATRSAGIGASRKSRGRTAFPTRSISTGCSRRSSATRRRKRSNARPRRCCCHAMRPRIDGRTAAA